MDSISAAAVESSSNIENDHNIFSSEDKKEQNDFSHSRRGRFRFKSSKSDRNSHDDRRHRQHRRHHHGHHHSRKRQKVERSPSPHSSRKSTLSPNSAFRESLFDALGDDEGAAFWESVYGQPIHTYAIPSVPKGPEGQLERMTDEEYVAYVRAQMWKRTHRGILEEREKLREERANEKEKIRKQEEDRLRFDRAIEASLERGRERQRAKAWETVWDEYQRSWEELNNLVLATEAGTASGSSEGKTQEMRFRNHIFWPVRSGKRRDISHDGVEEFMRHALPSDEDKHGTTSNLVAILKTERVRWHPDKIQQRYGVLGIDEPVIRGVTAVFQILDKLWGDERERQQNR